eukprot:CAMPEP_0198139672 /NCGR_PEP_ID=MMETSP1443-20131203/2946_1 /TAXON_ID=186043 /ORGANISM="Entomoneis sp., Strain CCMP2396" /LENGTH=398 /DNA_ID=CAMNT_0043801871 /DNA_START=56 /DNA_END=1252 /DNA_ORIENTATION=+
MVESTNSADVDGGCVEDDPFDMFGGDDDEDDDADNNDDDDSDNSNEPNKRGAALAARDPENGFNLYHPGTELALLQYVRNGCSDSAAAAGTYISLDTVIRLVDEFCYQRHWMMHIGPEKGQLLDDFLLSRIQNHLSKSTQNHSSKSTTTTTTVTATTSPLFVILEVGTYCGYSCTRMIRTLQKAKADAAAAATDFHFHIITVDVDPLHTRVAKQLHQLALTGGSVINDSSSDYSNQQNITYITLDHQQDQSLAFRVKDALKQIPTMPMTNNNAAAIMITPSFVFLDHDKDLYKEDLQNLESEGLIRKDCAVAADNVVFFRLDDYRNYIQQHADQRIVSTQLVTGQVEYMNANVIPPALPTSSSTSANEQHQQEEEEEDWQDGIELSIYLKDPPSHEGC